MSGDQLGLINMYTSVMQQLGQLEGTVSQYFQSNPDVAANITSQLANLSFNLENMQQDIGQMEFSIQQQNNPSGQQQVDSGGLGGSYGGF